MGKNRLRILAIVIGILSLTLLFPVTPALALPEITISPTSGSVGTKVTVSGTGFESFRGTDVSVFFGNVEIANSPLTVPENGTFTTDFEIPGDTEPGTIYVRVTTVIGGEVRKSFIVQEPEIELDTDEGPVNTTVIVEGKGFYAGGTVDLHYYKDGSKVKVGEEVAGPAGEFTYTFSVPDSFAGKRRVNQGGGNIVYFSWVF
jgi:hypothetical protein